MRFRLHLCSLVSVNRRSNCAAGPSLVSNLVLQAPNTSVLRPSSLYRIRNPSVGLFLSRRNEEPEEGMLLIRIVDGIVQVLQTPLLAGVEVGFLGILGLVAITKSPLQALIASSLFFILTWLGQLVVLENEEEEEEDSVEVKFIVRLFAVFIATFAGSLITPGTESESIWSLTSLILILGIPAGAVVSGVANNRLDEPSYRERELDDWDDKYRSSKQTRDDNQ